MKISLKIKKKPFLIVLIITIVVFIVILVSSLFIFPLRLESAKSDLKNYLLNEFKISTIKSTEESESFSSYERIFVKRSIKYLAEGGNKLSLIEYLNIIEGIKISFENECTKENFEYCDPYKILMPYCIIVKHPASWVDKENLEIFKEDVDENITYNEAIKYWRTYIEKQELKEDDLSAFVGFVTAEKLCGELNQNDAENLLEKLLKIEIDKDQPVEKIVHSLKKKVSVIRELRELQDPNYFNQSPQYKNSNSLICNKIPSISEIKKINDVCVAHDYYRVKAFCTKGPVINSIRDYLLATRYLKERYSNLDEIVCQLSFYHLTEK